MTDHIRITFVDQNLRNIQALLQVFGKGFTYKVDSIEKENPKNKAFISPANSFLFMDGGIDRVYSRQMCPGIENHLRQTKLPSLGIATHLGRPYLPVGSATITEWGGFCLISAPTMFLPHDVSRTRNAYHAFMAALCVFQKWRRMTGSTINEIVCPAMCTGWGNMPPEVAAKQMYDAYCDFKSGRCPQEISHWNDPTWFIAPSRDHEQPDNFDNREIKIVPLRAHLAGNDLCGFPL